MNLAAIDPHTPLASIDSIKAYLAGVVTAAAGNRGPKVQLTYVGGEFRKLTGVPFERHLNDLAEQETFSVPKDKRKLAGFVQSYCRDLIGMERSDAGTWLVFPVGHAGTTEAEAPATGTAMLRFKPAVWAAFIRPIAAAHRYLNLDPIGFTDVDDAPASGNWKEIAQDFVLGLPADAAVDGARVQSLIEAWAAASSVPISSLIVTAKTPDPAPALRKLLDLIDLLPLELAASWSIPAAVLKHLARTR